MNHRYGIILAFIVAVLLTTLLGSVFQTQVNLANMRDIGPPVEFTMRLHNTWHDLTHFALLYVVIVFATLLVALPLAEWFARKLPGHRMVWIVVAAIVGLALCFQIVDALAPMPTFIAATRSYSGTLAMLLAAAIGAMVYVLMTPYLNSPRDLNSALDTQEKKQ